MNKLALTLAFLALATSITIAQHLYLSPDSTCLQRMEYQANSAANSYISYTAKLGTGTVLIMDVGAENPLLMRSRPDKVFECRNFAPTPDEVERLNKGVLKLTLLKHVGDALQAIDVQKVTLVQRQGSRVVFYSSDAAFAFSPDSLSSGNNLAFGNSPLQVFLEGIVRTQCADGYIFRKKSEPTATSYKEWVYLPAIGIVEKNSILPGSLATSEKRTSLRLDKIDGTPWSNVLTAYCDDLQAAYYDGRPSGQKTGSDYSDLVPGNQPATSGTAPSADDCKPSDVPGLHIVQKGETLYGISRRYGIPLDDLRKWNGLLTSDLISLCQQLYVTDPATLRETPATTAPTTSVPPATAQQPSAGTSSWQKAAEYHTVRPGETVPMLAYAYGYTEERFRKMNGLSPAETIVPGQRLRTSDCVCPPAAGSAALSDGTGAAPASEPKPEEKAEDVFYQPVKVHLVQKSDTLYSIAKQYNTTPERILELNGMTKGDKIKVNQKLYVQ